MKIIYSIPLYLTFSLLIIVNSAHSTNLTFPVNFFDKYSFSYSISSAGNEGGGGGDPHAIEFLKIGDEIVQNMRLNSNYQSTAKEFETHIFRLRESLDNPDMVPLLRFQDVPVLCNNAPKIACTYNKTEEVLVYRNAWNVLLPSQKYQVVLLEVFQLMNMVSRYSISQALSEMQSFTKCEEPIASFFLKNYKAKNVKPSYIMSATERFTIQKVNFMDTHYEYSYEVITKNKDCVVVSSSRASIKAILK